MSPSPHVECILACPEHGDLYNVRRAPAGPEGSFRNEIVPVGGGAPIATAKACPTCGGPLARKEPHRGR